jgi:hypothetical protein
MELSRWVLRRHSPQGYNGVLYEAMSVPLSKYLIFNLLDGLKREFGTTS